MGYEKVLVATDFSQASRAALQTAGELCSAGQSKLYLVHVVETPVVYGPPFMGASGLPLQDQLLAGASDHLNEIVSEYYPSLQGVETIVLGGSPARSIADFAKEEGVDLIVVGSHGRHGLGRILMGSTAEKLLSIAPCQVLVAKPWAKIDQPQAKRTETEPV